MGLSAAAARSSPTPQMRTVAHVRGHNDDVNAVAYAEQEAPQVIFSGSDDSFVKVGAGLGAAGQAVLARTRCASGQAASAAALLLPTGCVHAAPSCRCARRRCGTGA